MEVGTENHQQQQQRDIDETPIHRNTTREHEHMTGEYYDNEEYNDEVVDAGGGDQQQIQFPSNNVSSGGTNTTNSSNTFNSLHYLNSPPRPTPRLLPRRTNNNNK